MATKKSTKKTSPKKVQPQLEFNIPAAEMQACMNDLLVSFTAMSRRVTALERQVTDLAHAQAQSCADWPKKSVEPKECEPSHVGGESQPKIIEN